MSEDNSKKTQEAKKASKSGFTEAEKAAMKERAKESKAEARRGNLRQAGEADLLAKIKEMPENDRLSAERVHEIVSTVAPQLMPKTWYGMPAYANEQGKVVCFFQAAAKFDARYATFGFNDTANLDDGSMWPTSFALIKITPAVDKQIQELVKKATLTP